MSNDDFDCCDSCGEEWRNHKSAVDTCKALQRAKHLLEDLLTYAKQPEYDRDIGVQEIYFDLIKQVEGFLK